MPVVVVYDVGSAAAGEIVQSIGGPDLVVVLAPNDHARSAKPIFEEKGCTVVDFTTVQYVAGALRGRSLSGILTFSERMLRTTADLADRLGLNYHTPEVALRLTDKARQRAALREAGVDSVASRVVTTPDAWAEAVRVTGLPAVVKPVHGEGSRSTVLVRDEADGYRVVSQLLRTEAVLVVEEYLAGVPVTEPFGDYVSVETAVTPDARSHYAITGKFQLAPPFRESGQFWPAAVDEPTRAAVVDLADRAITALGVTSGLVHTEIKLTPAGPRMIEVNGRLGGLQAELAARAAGLDLLAVAAGLAADRPAPPAPVQPDWVHFQHYTPGPTATGTVRAATGAAAVRALPQVVRVRQLVRAGAAVGGTDTRRLDVVSGAVPRHEDLPQVIEEIRNLLGYEFDHAGTSVRRTAADLVRYP